MGSSKGGGSSAPLYNPAQQVQNQQASNVNTAIANAWLNNTNQITPYGSVTYRHTGTMKAGDQDVPQFTAEVSLSPEQKKLYDTQTAISQGALDLGKQYTQRIGDATSQAFNYDGLPNAPVYNEDFRRQQLANIQARAQPLLDRQRAQLEQQLADRGVGMQDPAYRTAMDQYQRGLNDFQLGADLQAGQEAQNAYNLAASTRDRSIQERANLRTQPINEVATLLGLGSGGVKDPTFINTPQVNVAPTDVIGAYSNANQQQFAQQMAQQQMAQQQTMGLMGGLFGLGSAGLMGGLMRR